MQHDTIAGYPKRPPLVSILAVLLTIQGILTILAGIFAIINLTSVLHLSIQGYVVTHPVIDIISYLLGGMSLALGIGLIVLAIGLWRLRHWAFWATIVLLAINLAIQIALFIRPYTQNGIEILSLAISVAISLLLLLYFLLFPNIRRAFRSRTPK